MPKEVFKIEIVVFDDGNIKLSGPLDNQALMLGILESAKFRVREHNKAKDDARVAADLALAFDHPLNHVVKELSKRT